MSPRRFRRPVPFGLSMTEFVALNDHRGRVGFAVADRMRRASRATSIPTADRASATVTIRTAPGPH